MYSPSDLSKKWFVYWYEGSRRIKKYGDINKCQTEAERHKAAARLIESLKQKHLRIVTNTEEAVRALIEKEKPQWREKTVQQYTSTANILFSFLDGREIDQDLLNEFLQEIKDTRHGTTYNRYIVMTKRFIDRSRS